MLIKDWENILNAEIICHEKQWPEQWRIKNTFSTANRFLCYCSQHFQTTDSKTASNTVTSCTKPLEIWSGIAPELGYGPGWPNWALAHIALPLVLTSMVMIRAMKNESQSSLHHPEHLSKLQFAIWLIASFCRVRDIFQEYYFSLRLSWAWYKS